MAFYMVYGKPLYTHDSKNAFRCSSWTIEKLLESFITKEGNFINEEHQGGKAEVQEVLTVQQLHIKAIQKIGWIFKHTAPTPHVHTSKYRITLYTPQRVFTPSVLFL